MNETEWVRNSEIVRTQRRLADYRQTCERLEAENAALRHTLEQCKAMGALLVEVVAGTAKAALARELLATFHVEAAAQERDG